LKIKLAGQIGRVSILGMMTISFTVKATGIDLSHDVLRALESSTLVSELGLTITSNSALGLLENQQTAKYWVKAEGSDCFYTVEIVYNKMSKKIEAPNNKYGISNPVQSDGITACGE
jgi:hypothetical protein